jgi:iron(III) transport system substrate-binding protein
VLLLAACGEGEPSGGNADFAAPTSMEELVSEAQKEGEVVLYASLTPPQIERAEAAFEAKYDIEFTALRLTSGPINQRFLGELQTNSLGADVLSTAGPEIFEQDLEADSNHFVPVSEYPDEVVEDWPELGLRENRVLVNIIPMALTYNASMLNAEPPSKWCDIIDPKYAGKFVYVDPRGVPANMGHLSLMEQECGPEWLTTFATLDFDLVDSGSAGVQQLAAGENALSFPNNRAHAADVAEVVSVQDMTPSVGYELEAAIATAAPHPNAGRLLMYWLMSREGQEALNGGPMESTSVRFGDIPGAIPLPEDYVSLDLFVDEQREQELLKLIGLS